MHDEIVDGPMFSFARKSNPDKMEELIDVKVVCSAEGPLYLWRTRADVQENRPFQGGETGKGYPIFKKLPTKAALARMAPAHLGGYYHKKEGSETLGDWWSTSGSTVFKEVERFTTAPETREHFTDEQRAAWAGLKASTPKSDAEHASLIAELRAGRGPARLYLPEWGFPQRSSERARAPAAPDGGAPLAERAAAAAAAANADRVSRVVPPGGIDERNQKLKERKAREKAREDEKDDLEQMGAIENGERVKIVKGQFIIAEFQWKENDAMEDADSEQKEPSLETQLAELTEDSYQQGLFKVKEYNATKCTVTFFFSASCKEHVSGTRVETSRG